MGPMSEHVNTPKSGFIEWVKTFPPEARQMLLVTGALVTVAAAVSALLTGGQSIGPAAGWALFLGLVLSAVRLGVAWSGIELLGGGSLNLVEVLVVLFGVLPLVAMALIQLFKMLSG